MGIQIISEKIEYFLNRNLYDFSELLFIVSNVTI